MTLTPWGRWANSPEVGLETLHGDPDGLVVSQGVEENLLLRFQLLIQEENDILRLRATVCEGRQAAGRDLHDLCKSLGGSHAGVLLAQAEPQRQNLREFWSANPVGQNAARGPGGRGARTRAALALARSTRVNSPFISTSVESIAAMCTSFPFLS